MTRQQKKDAAALVFLGIGVALMILGGYFPLLVIMIVCLLIVAAGQRLWEWYLGDE